MAETLHNVTMRDVKNELVIQCGKDEWVIGAYDKQPIEKRLQPGQALTVSERKPGTQFLRKLAEIAPPGGGGTAEYHLPLDGVAARRTLKVTLDAREKEMRLRLAHTPPDKDLFGGFFR